MKPDEKHHILSKTKNNITIKHDGGYIYERFYRDIIRLFWGQTRVNKLRRLGDAPQIPRTQHKTDNEK